jgi:hypothetical protein
MSRLTLYCMITDDAWDITVLRAQFVEFVARTKNTAKRKRKTKRNRTGLGITVAEQLCVTRNRVTQNVPLLLK